MSLNPPVTPFDKGGIKGGLKGFSCEEIHFHIIMFVIHHQPVLCRGGDFHIVFS